MKVYEFCDFLSRLTVCGYNGSIRVVLFVYFGKKDTIDQVWRFLVLNIRLYPHLSTSSCMVCNFRTHLGSRVIVKLLIKSLIRGLTLCFRAVVRFVHYHNSNSSVCLFNHNIISVSQRFYDFLSRQKGCYKTTSTCCQLDEQQPI